MVTLTPQELFTEACKLQYPFLIPSSVVTLISLMSKFCDEHKLEWGIEKGVESSLCVFIICPDEWSAEMESHSLRDCIIQAVSLAWDRVSRPDNIISLEEWKRRHK